jgi:hypothetical protein
VEKKSDNKPIVSVIMGSQSDWSTMNECCEILDQLKVFHEVKIISAHRTPDRLFNFSKKINDELKLKSTYITNILKCVPPGDKPLNKELIKCSNYFIKELLNFLETMVLNTIKLDLPY